MNKIFKIISYLSVSLFFSYLESLGSGIFFDNLKNNIIPLLATLLAINITTGALISTELKKFTSQFPNASSIDVSKELRFSFIIQLISLVFLFIVLLINDIITKEITYIKYSEYLTNTIIIGVFLYYLEIILDLGKALFKILNANNK